MVMPYFPRSAQELISLGLTPQVGESQQNFLTRGNQQIGAGIPIQQPVVTGPVSEAGPSLLTRAEQIARGWADPMGEAAPAPTSEVGFALPGGVAGALGALGVSTATLGVLGLGYGLTQMAGLQYPWETGPGEGFISPFTRDIVQDESGRWVTRETRPDLFANGQAAPSTAMVPAMAGGAVVGAQVVKTWTANGWPFVMTSDGRIHTVTKSGIRKSWKPYRSVVLGKNPSPRMLNRAVTKLVQFDKLHSRIQKMARRIKT